METLREQWVFNPKWYSSMDSELDVLKYLIILRIIYIGVAWCVCMYVQVPSESRRGE